MDHLTHINPPTLSDSLAVGYSQVVVAEPGKMVFVAGQVGWDTNSEMVGDASFCTQARKAIGNVRIALEEA
ncbi:MAG: RidA family protein, partial [Rhodospirillaceae bacterium]|nr:RidA family protein [Rhodospirillaceae bacterium]